MAQITDAILTASDVVVENAHFTIGVDFDGEEINYNSLNYNDFSGDFVVLPKSKEYVSETTVSSSAATSSDAGYLGEHADNDAANAVASGGIGVADDFYWRTTDSKFIFWDDVTMTWTESVKTTTETDGTALSGGAEFSYASDSETAWTDLDTIRESITDKSIGFSINGESGTYVYLTDETAVHLVTTVTADSDTKFTFQAYADKTGDLTLTLDLSDIEDDETETLGTGSVSKQIKVLSKPTFMMLAETEREFTVTSVFQNPLAEAENAGDWEIEIGEYTQPVSSDEEEETTVKYESDKIVINKPSQSNIDDNKIGDNTFIDEVISLQASNVAGSVSTSIILRIMSAKPIVLC